MWVVVALIIGIPIIWIIMISNIGANGFGVFFGIIFTLIYIAIIVGLVDGITKGKAEQYLADKYDEQHKKR